MKALLSQSRLDEAQRDLIQNYDEPYVPKPRNHHVRDTIEVCSFS
jgi:hypothetical protein